MRIGALLEALVIGLIVIAVIGLVLTIIILGSR